MRNMIDKMNTVYDFMEALVLQVVRFRYARCPPIAQFYAHYKSHSFSFLLLVFGTEEKKSFFIYFPFHFILH